MKTVFNLVLVLCAAALIYICYTSIMGPINFENAKKEREKAVIARLIDIRKAQQEYRSLHRGMYAPKLDTLIDFVKNQKLPLLHLCRLSKSDQSLSVLDQQAVHV